MSDPIRISELSDIRAANLGLEDEIVINDVTVGGGTPITRKTSLDTFLRFVEGEDLEFTGDVSFESIKPGDNDLNVTVDSIHINKSLSLSSTADISGIRVEDLDNVVLGGVPIKNGQVLGYQNGKWVNMNQSTQGGGGGGDTIVGVEEVTETGLFGRRVGEWEKLDFLNPPVGSGLYGYNATTNGWQQIAETALTPPIGNGIYAWDGVNGEWIDISGRLMPDPPEPSFRLIYDDSQRP